MAKISLSITVLSIIVLCGLVSCKKPSQSGISLQENGHIQNKYAKMFDMSIYENGDILLKTGNEYRYYITKSKDSIPLDLDATFIPQSPSSVYIVASNVIALWNAIDGIKNIKFSSIKDNNIQIHSIASALKNGDILFAGKYSAPDYEMLLDKGCDLAIESTMIFHSPEVKEKLEALEIPVFIDMSSYEENPLGRLEWIKVYGAISGQLQKATDFFESQEALVLSLPKYTGEKKKVIFFYINSFGLAVVRKPSDYISSMIEMAGGDYAITEDMINGFSNSSSPYITISIEELFNLASSADILIYNAGIGKVPTSLSDLISMNSLFEEFKAVKYANVWVTDSSLYQLSDRLALIIADMHSIFKPDSIDKTEFLERLKRDD